VLSTKSVPCALALVALGLLSGACASKNPSSLASDTTGAEDVNGTESDVESLGSSFVGSDGQSVVKTSAFAPAAGDIRTEGLASAANAGFYFQPAGCEVTTVDTSSQTVTYAFDGCTGPLGLVELTGSIDVTWQLAQGQLTLDYSASDFHVNRATITSWQATAVVTASGAARTMTWNAQLAGTTGSGRTFTRTNQKTLSWTVGVPCLSVTGESTGDILRARLQTTVDAWRRCADSCPEAGSEITVKNLDDGDSLSIRYLGGPDADLTLDGRTEEIGLACGL
jgi:hypothetical protein